MRFLQIIGDLDIKNLINYIDNYSDERSIIQKDTTLQIIYNDILNRDEVTEKKIKDIIANGVYIFARDERESKCFVSLKCSSNVMYSLNEILNLRGRAFLIVKQQKKVNKNKNI